MKELYGTTIQPLASFSQQHNLCSYIKVTSWRWSSLQYLSKYYNPMTLKPELVQSILYIYTSGLNVNEFVWINTLKTEKATTTTNHKLYELGHVSDIQILQMLVPQSVLSFGLIRLLRGAVSLLKHRSHFRHHEICLFGFFIVDLASWCCFMWCLFISGALHPKKFPRAES